MNLPNINFTVKNTAEIEEELIKHYENLIGRILYPADPIRLFLLPFAKYINLQRSLIDFSAKQNLLQYSTDGYIEHIGSLLGVNRLQPQKAKTMLKFMLSQIQDTTVIIPKGTRATSNNIIYFETIEITEIPMGQTQVEVQAECTTVGDGGNGFEVEQINILVDAFGFVTAVTNTTVSAGGAYLEPLENYRERIRVAPESFSTAGPDKAYEYWAKTANQLIGDVVVKSPNPGEVEIIPLLNGGEIPTEDIIASVYEICNDKTKRPLTDKLIVNIPEIVTYNININYYINYSDYVATKKIQDNVNKSINEYTVWQRSKLGRDINPSELIRRVINAGAKRVEVISPIFSKTEYRQIAIPQDINIIYGGVEHD